VLIVIFLLNGSADNLLYGGGCPRSRVCVGVNVGIEIAHSSPSVALSTLLALGNSFP
jgi:hypothetical protein